MAYQAVPYDNLEYEDGPNQGFDYTNQEGT